MLVQLLLMSRIAWLERAIGLDRLAVWHRWTGFATVWLLLGHVVFTTVGYAQGDDVSLWAQTPRLRLALSRRAHGVGRLRDVPRGRVSHRFRIARRKLKRQTWYFVHLYAYLAVALTFAHQLAVGTDFSDDRVARMWWVGLYARRAGAILWWRVHRAVCASTFATISACTR